MGSRKKEKAKRIKDSKKNLAFARLRNYPTSPRKMRLVADMIRGIDVTRALDLLRYSPKHASIPMEKLLKSAISNWEQKNEGKQADSENLYVKEIYVDSARMLKRIRPAPQGRANRIRKRSNHVTLFIGNKNEIRKNNEEKVDIIEEVDNKTEINN